MSRILAAAVLVAGVAALDRWLPAREPGLSREAPQPFLSAGWYCGVPGGDGVSAAVATANLGDEPVKLRRWGAWGSQASPIQEGELAPRTRGAVNVADFGIPEGSAVVEAFGSATASNALVFVSGMGAAAARCSVQPWTRWLFATASTARGWNTYLMISNPFREEAVVRVRIMTSEGDAVPARLKDLVVPELSQAAVFLPEYYPETESFAVEVTATRGRVFASRYSRVSTRDGLRGIDLDLGLREPSVRWQFAAGDLPEQGEELIVLANPSGKEALVQVFFQTGAEQLSPPALQEVAVPAGRQVTVNVADHLPRGTLHGTAVVSTNRVPIVAERQNVLVVSGGRKVESAYGVAGPGPRWVLPAGSPAGGQDRLFLVNPESEQAVFSVKLIRDGGEVRPPELGSIALDGGRQMMIDLTPFLEGGPATAVVEAAAGVVVAENRLVLGDPYRDFADAQGTPF